MMNKNTYISLFDLFKIGIGPSSSHTVGPMVASNKYIGHISKQLNELISIKIELFGSLAHTGYGHKINNAIIMGLTGIKPENVTNSLMEKILAFTYKKRKIKVNDTHIIDFQVDNCIKYNKDKTYKYHSNAITFKSTYANSTNDEKLYFSIGGGFVIEENEKSKINNNQYKYTFNSSKDLLNICANEQINIYDVILHNEYMINDKKSVDEYILHIVDVMNNCIKDGISKTGKIDDILSLDRRANTLYNKLKTKELYDPLEVLDWVNIFAIATCEENASGSKIVTAPTNGAAGIIPAVLRYYQKFIKDSNDEGIIKFMATSSAIGMLFKINSSISGAEVGCQGEVGVACSMAAAGLTAVLGGTAKQIENAAEIAMEHNLGLTCDPVKGLVQIPCIERNSMGAIKAINASRLSLNSDDNHKVSLDQVIKTMNDTGKSMSKIYKETSLGGLAVNVVEC